ncbi:glycoside hydrolase family 1 protein [Amycolatopsis anabasis]|uniref:glycoside hydrolase family 1 protein n=1 Tax=Amycolatopsis anabasis TaxID=1840409 RepID=UPI00131B961D|nr:family 1 glycosylhydrolase [Amycolatopsis anabasis]
MPRTRALLASVLVGCGCLAVPDAAAAPDPEPFHWGVASSGFQSEGSAPDSNWRRYAETEEPYRNSVDFRHRYAADIALAKDLGVNTYRFGVEWARIEPAKGRLDETELAYYDDVVRRVRAAGMTPMITLDHWVYPGWVADQGAWDNPATVGDWLANARRVVGRYAHQGVLWITFNEPVIYLQKEISGRKLNPFQIAAMRQHLVAAHRNAYDEIHRLDPGSRVSSNLAYLPPPLQQLTDPLFTDAVADKLDFVGLDYYYGLSLDNLTAIHGATGELWKIDPQPDGLYYALRAYQRKFPRLPLYVVENGMPTDDGKPRADGYTRSDHLRDHVYWLRRARDEGVNVLGYNYWSLTDNYEWGSYRPRFGLYTVDVATDPALTRRPTDAVDAYRRVIADGGVPADYTPVRRPAWCAFADLRTCLANLPWP